MDPIIDWQILLDDDRHLVLQELAVLLRIAQDHDLDAAHLPPRPANETLTVNLRAHDQIPAALRAGAQHEDARRIPLGEAERGIELREAIVGCRRQPEVQHEVHL